MKVQQLGAGIWWKSIAYGNGKYVAVGYNGYTTSSTDGISWTTPKQVGTDDWMGITFGIGRFMAVGKNGYVTSSTDGISWSVPTQPGGDRSYIATTFGDGKFVTLCTGGSTCFISTNAATWDGFGSIFTQTSSHSQTIGYGNGKFIVFGASNSNGCKVNVSTDGYTWKKQSDTQQLYIDAITGVAYGNGKYVAVTGFYYTTSTNGENWKSGKVIDSIYPYLNCLTFGNGYFVTCGNNGIIYFSPDGENWTKVDNSVTETINAVYVM